MLKYVYICDNCKKEAERNVQTKPNGWKSIKIEYEQYKTTTLLLCPECQAKLGLPVDEPKYVSEVQMTSLADKLYDIVAQIVSEVNEG